MLIPHRSHNFTASSPRSNHLGFTLVELMMIFVMIGLITTLAFPSIQSMGRYNNSFNVASHLTGILNGARDQAGRRNRAYEVRVNELSENTPKGVVTVYEAATQSCQSILRTPQLLSQLEVNAYGGSTLPNAKILNEPSVGLRGWRLDGQVGYQEGELRLCYSARGGLFIHRGTVFTEVLGRLQLGIQEFDGPPWAPFGPPRHVELTFSSGARVHR